MEKPESRPEQLKRTEQALFQLLKDYPNCVSVQFVSHKDSMPNMHERRMTEETTRAFLSSDKHIALVLVEPTTQEELDQWANAIVKAEELLDHVNKVISHENSHPDWFKAIKSKYYNMNVLSAILYDHAQ